MIDSAIPIVTQTGRVPKQVLNGDLARGRHLLNDAFLVAAVLEAPCCVRAIDRRVH